MVAAHVVRATRYESASEEALIKTKTLGPDSRLKFRLRSFANRRREYSVEIVQNWTIGLTEDVNVLVGAPGYFTANPYVLFEKQEVATEAGVTAPSNGLGLVVAIEDVV